jgi:hypothetical protein
MLCGFHQPKQNNQNKAKRRRNTSFLVRIAGILQGWAKFLDFYLCLILKLIFSRK